MGLRLRPARRRLHMRQVRPEMGRKLPVYINQHSVKNRFLMRIKNITPDLYARVLVPATLRDLMVLASICTIERESLPALAVVARNLPRLWRARREIQGRRRSPVIPLRRWVGCRSIPLDDA